MNKLTAAAVAGWLLAATEAACHKHSVDQPIEELHANWKQAQESAHVQCLTDAVKYCGYYDPGPVTVARFPATQSVPPPPRFTMEEEDMDKVLDDMMDRMMSFHPVPMLRVSPQAFRPIPLSNLDTASPAELDVMVDQIISDMFGVPVDSLDEHEEVAEIQVKEEEEEGDDQINYASATIVGASNNHHEPIAAKYSLTSHPNSSMTLWEQLADRVTFVNFCRSSCHWCTQMMSEWELMAKQRQDVANIVFVDCDVDTRFCMEEAVIATPSMRLYTKRQSRFYDEYMDGRTAEQMMAFLDTYLESGNAPEVNSEEEEEELVSSDSGDLAESKSRSDSEDLAESKSSDSDDDMTVSKGISDSEDLPEATSSSDMPVSKSSRRKSFGSSSKDDVTPWMEEEARVSRFAEQLEPRPQMQEEEVPDLRHRMRRRLMEVAPALEQESPVYLKDLLYTKDHVPSMGFDKQGAVERCLANRMDLGLPLSFSCSLALSNLNARVQQLEQPEDYELPWYTYVIAFYAVFFFLLVGLFLLKRVQQKKLASFHQDRKLRQDVLRHVHGNEALKQQIEEALGQKLEEEAMTVHPLTSFKKKMGCMGMFCISLPRLAILFIYMSAAFVMPSLVLTVIVPMFVCMSLYGYVMYCCCHPKEDEEGMEYPGNRRAVATNEPEEPAYEAIPVI